jgi:V/A-type H+-transporting ATPase subunit E
LDYNTNERIYIYFENEIKRLSAKQSDLLRKEINDLKEKELEKIEKELKESIENAAKREIKELQVDHSYEINKILADNSQKLMKRRLEMLEVVFSEVQARLMKYVTSKAYEELINSKLKDIADKFSGCSVVFKVKPSDKILIDCLKANYKHKYKIELDPKIKIGGFAIFCDIMNIEIDETIDFRLQEQKEWFYAKSNLYVK